jgi:hypothetical protein
VSRAGHGGILTSIIQATWVVEIGELWSEASPEQN